MKNAAAVATVQDAESYLWEKKHNAAAETTEQGSKKKLKANRASPQHPNRQEEGRANRQEQHSSAAENPKPKCFCDESQSKIYGNGNEQHPTERDTHKIARVIGNVTVQISLASSQRRRRRIQQADSIITRSLARAVLNNAKD